MHDITRPFCLTNRQRAMSLAPTGSPPDDWVNRARVIVASDHSGTGEDMSILLVQEHDNLWNLPGGRKEDCDASLEMTALRELREETGPCDAVPEYFDIVEYQAYFVYKNDRLDWQTLCGRFVHFGGAPSAPRSPTI